MNNALTIPLERRSWIDLLRICLVVTIPLIYQVCCVSQFFGNSILDPYHYLALFIHYTDPSFCVGAYKIARLPWILLGSGFFHLFSPDRAQLLLSLFLNGSILLGFYLTTRMLFGGSISFIVTMALGFSSWFNDLMSTGGCFYHNLCAIAFYVWGFYFLSKAVIQQKRPFLFLMISGIFSACALHCQILFINFLPILALHFLFFNRNNHRHPFLSSIGSFLAGAIAITILLMIINYFFRGDFCFFRNLIALVTQFYMQPSLEKAWWMPWRSFWFLSTAYWILPFSLLVSWFTLFLGENRWKDLEAKNAVVIAAQLFIVVAIYIGWQSTHHHVLNVPYMAFPLIIPTFFALAALLRISLAHECFLDKMIHSFVISFLFFVCSIIPFQWLPHSQLFYETLFGMILLFSGVRYFKIKHSAFFYLFVIALVIFNNFSLQLIGSFCEKDTFSSTRRELNQVVYEAQKMIGGLGRYKKIAVWYPIDGEKVENGLLADLTWTAVSIANFWVQDRSPLDEFHTQPEPLKVASLSSKSIQTVLNNDLTLVLVTREKPLSDDLHEQFVKRFGSEGVALDLIANRTIQKGEVYCNIKALKAIKMDEKA